MAWVDIEDGESGLDVRGKLNALGTVWGNITPGTGVATALGVNVGSAGAFVTFNGALGTPSSGTLTNCTGLPLAGVAGAGTMASQAASAVAITGGSGLFTTDFRLTASGNSIFNPIFRNTDTTNSGSGMTLTVRGGDCWLDIIARHSLDARIRTLVSRNIVFGVNSTDIASVTSSGLNLEATKTLSVNGTQVVTAQQAAVADATGAGDVVAQLNALLARLRTHGLIAT